MSAIVWVEELAVDLPRAVAAGFTQVALPARLDRPRGDLEALAEAGVVVAAVRLRGELTLADVEARREQLRLLKRQLTDAARLGATLVWLSPGELDDETARTYFQEGFDLLTDQARGYQMQLRSEMKEIVHFD